MRIATTLPSATEIVCRLGLEPVAVSHGCDYPPEVVDRPAITRSRIDADASSGEIDAQVLEATGGEATTDGDTAETDADDGTGVYEIDRTTLEATEPDLVLTQGMCDVCAVDSVIVERAVEAIDIDPAILTTDPHSIEDVLADIQRIGDAAGVSDRAAQVVADLEARIASVRERATDREPEERPRVAIFDWTNPVMIAGHWTAELVEWAGGAYGLADVGAASRPREWTEIVDYDPEVIVVGPCGFDLEQTAENAADLTEREGWESLTAVQADRVWAMNGNHYLNRPGPRLVDTLEALASIIQPARFPTPPATDVAVPVADLSGWDEASRLELET